MLIGGSPELGGSLISEIWSCAQNQKFGGTEFREINSEDKLGAEKYALDSLIISVFWMFGVHI